MKLRINQGKRTNLYFWRNNTGLEMDVLADYAGRLLPIEIKSGATLAPTGNAGTPSTSASKCLHFGYGKSDQKPNLGKFGARRGRPAPPAPHVNS